MNENHILDDVFELSRVLDNSDMLQSAESVEEKLRQMEHALTYYFAVHETLKMSSSKLDSNRLQFEHHIMWYSAYCEMLRKKSLDRADLSEDEILDKFRADLDQSK